MTAVIGMREFSRNLNMLDGYDYVKLEDKKTHEKKGIYIPQKYADEIEKIIQEKVMKERQAKFDRLKPFIGMCNGEFTHLKTNQDIREAYSKRFTDE